MLYTNNELRLMILNCLSKEPFLNGFEVVPSKRSIIKRDCLGYYGIELDGHTSVDPMRGSELSLMIPPRFIRYFKVLDKWTGPHIHVLQNHKGGLVVLNFSSDEYMANTHDFLRSGEGFNENYEKLCSTIQTYALPFFERFISLENMYDNIILPLLNNEHPRDMTSPIPYYYLVLTKIIAPEKLHCMKDCIMRQKESCNSSVFNLYYRDIEEIYEYIDSNSFLI